jgi:hypothetical protein
MIDREISRRDIVSFERNFLMINPVLMLEKIALEIIISIRA